MNYEKRHFAYSLESSVFLVAFSFFKYDLTERKIRYNIYFFNRTELLKTLFIFFIHARAI